MTVCLASGTMCRCHFTFNESDIGLKPYAATPAPETAAAASFCSWICQWHRSLTFWGIALLLAAALTPNLLHGGLFLDPKVPGR